MAQLAKEWGFSTDKIRELFRNEPGVLKLRDENACEEAQTQLCYPPHPTRCRTESET